MRKILSVLLVIMLVGMSAFAFAEQTAPAEQLEQTETAEQVEEVGATEETDATEEAEDAELAEPVEAETREETISVEGLEETITTTRFDSEMGYTIWIDATRLAHVPEAVGMDAFMGVEDPTIGVAAMGVNAMAGVDTGVTFDVALKGQKDVLVAAFGELEDIDVADAFGDLQVACFRGVLEGMVADTYVIDLGHDILMLSAQYPQEGAEGIGVRLQNMVASITVNEGTQEAAE